MDHGMLKPDLSTAGAKAQEEQGVALVITVLVMLVLLVAAAFAIDTAIWFVHGRHLQTQADAAALAAAQDYQFCARGSSTDTGVIDRVHQYDGTALTPLSPTYNAQVSVAPTPSSTYSSTQHNLVSRVNQPDYVNRTGYPGDTGLTGSPCADNTIDVKLTETNLSSFFPFISPAYIDAQARVGFQTAATGTGTPFVEPLPTPTSVAVEFVNETNGNVLSTPGVVSLSSSDNGNTFTAKSVSIHYADPTQGSTTDEFPVGMRVAVNPSGSGATFPCNSSETCYDNSSSTSNTGIVFTRVWSNSGTPGLPTSNPVAPQASHVWLQPCTASGNSCTACPTTPSPSLSNFFASSTDTTEHLCANMTFGTALTCANTGLTTKAGGTTVAMNCPNPPSGSANGTWSSGPLTVPAFIPASGNKAAVNNGAMNVTMSWSVTAGCLPVGATGGTNENGANPTCTQGAVHTKCGNGSNACTGNFDGSTSAETVQQAYSGAYSLSSGQSIAAGGIGPSNSGTISSASVTDSTGNEIQSIQNGTNTAANITVGFYGFNSGSTITGPPFELTLGGNQGNGDIGCNGNGVPNFVLAIENGCPGNYAATNVQPPSDPCPAGSTNSNPGPAVCVSTNPGGGKSKNISDALNQKINGGSNSCTSPNYWTSPNNVGQILAARYNGSPDPRLLELFYTDNVVLLNGSTDIPIRGFAEFYITGWGGAKKGTDPCLSPADGGSGTTGTNANNGLSYTTDTLPPDNTDGVVMGHFVTYVQALGNGSGTPCPQNSLNVCVPVLIK